MRILGGKDYYDGAGYGVDTEIIFDRGHGDLSKPDIEIKDKEYFPAIPPRMSSIGNMDDKGGAVIEFFNIIVSGKVYPGVKISKTIRKTFIPSYDKSITLHSYVYNKGDFIYDYEKAWAIAENLGFKDALWSNPKAKMHDHFRRELTKAEIEWLAVNKIVVAAILKPDDRYRYETRIWVNGDFLKLFKFYRVLDASTAHMEIANYVGGVLPGAANPMVEISDESKIVKHGHDLKVSFRNMPRD